MSHCYTETEQQFASHTPHVCRHATAMDLLHHGVDRSVIALWLGHESPETTQMYLHADMRLKEKALSHTEPPGVEPTRYRPDDTLLSFLESLSLCRLRTWPESVQEVYWKNLGIIVEPAC